MIDAAPADVAFTVLSTREIDPNDASTYSWDSAGSFGYRYRLTYVNR